MPQRNQATHNLKRIWHPYWAGEDFHAGMWTAIKAKDRKAMLDKAIEFTGNAVLYGKYMRQVAKLWPISCEHNLTDSGINRKAWIGHAACCLAIRCPEDVTREAWAHLTQQQQDEANAQADAAIAQWEHERKNTAVHQDLGAQRVFDWHS